MNGKQIELTIRPRARDCRVMLGGEDITDIVWAITVHVKAGRPTNITLECRKKDDADFSVSGFLCDEPPKEEEGEVVA